jgi:hypothetical protein
MCFKFFVLLLAVFQVSKSQDFDDKEFLKEVLHTQHISLFPPEIEQIEDGKDKKIPMRQRKTGEKIQALISEAQQTAARLKKSPLQIVFLGKVRFLSQLFQINRLDKYSYLT